MNIKRFYLPSKRQLSYRKFNVDEFKKRISSGGFNATRVLYWNYGKKRFQWDDGETCLVAFDEREFFLSESGLNDEPEADDVAEAIPSFCEAVRECSKMTYKEYCEEYGDKDNRPFYWTKPDIKRRLAESVARFLNGCGVRFDVEDIFNNFGRDDLIDADALERLDELDESHRFGGAFGYKFQRAKYEKIIAEVTGRRFVVRGDFNDPCFDENTVRAASEVLREHLNEVDKYAEFWLIHDSRGKAAIAGHVFHPFGYSGIILATF